MRYSGPPYLRSPLVDMRRMHTGELEMQLPLRKDLKDAFVFRRAVQTLTGFDISDNEAISYAMMARGLLRVG